jgi:hypothetical protein
MRVCLEHYRLLQLHLELALKQSAPAKEGSLIELIPPANRTHGIYASP